jgi:hypothetical protein
MSSSGASSTNDAQQPPKSPDRVDGALLVEQSDDQVFAEQHLPDARLPHAGQQMQNQNNFKPVQAALPDPHERDQKVDGARYETKNELNSQHNGGDFRPVEYALVEGDLEIQHVDSRLGVKDTSKDYDDSQHLYHEEKREHAEKPFDVLPASKTIEEMGMDVQTPHNTVVNLGDLEAPDEKKILPSIAADANFEDLLLQTMDAAAPLIIVGGTKNAIVFQRAHIRLTIF